MKILKKTEVNAEANKQKQFQIEEGVALATRIDTLRRTKAEEEAKLESFRKEAIKTVQNEIDAKIRESKHLDIEIREKKEERLKLEAPIDLTDEWKKVNGLKSELFTRETQLITREALVHNLEKREAAIVEKEIQATQFLDEARKSYTKTDDLRSDMETRKNESDALIDDRLEVLSKKEADLVIRERNLKSDKERVVTDQKEILDKGTSLIGRESKLEGNIKALFSREEKIKEKEALTDRYNDEASKNYDISDRVKSETQAVRDEAEKDIQGRYIELTDKERKFGYKERDLILQKEGLEIERKSIEKEKLHIASQQQSLREAWIGVKKLQEELQNNK